MGASFSAKPDSTEFYSLTLATATTWTLGGLLHTPPNGSGHRPDRPVLTPILIGVGAFGLFYGCGLVARRIPLLRNAITGVMRYAEQGRTPPVLLITLANGAAEEMFFRGTVYNAAGSHPVAVSTGLYALATASTRNPALILASGVMGALFGLQRRTTGSIQAPMLTHLTWSTLMLRYLPNLFRSPRAAPPPGP